MAVYKRLKCSSCGSVRNVASPRAVPCKRCGGATALSTNWYISFYAAGRKRVEAVSTDKRVAMAAEGKRRAQVHEGKIFEAQKSIPWPQAAREMLAWARANKSPNTVQQYSNSLKQMEPHFGHLTLDKITPQDVEHYKAERSMSSSNATVNRDLATIKRLFTLAESWGMVGANQINTVEKLSECPRERFLSADEISRLVSECSHVPALRMAVVIALETGLRKEGVRTLEWTDIDFGRGVITRTDKGGGTLRIPLTSRLREELTAYRGTQKIMSRYVLNSPYDPSRPYTDFKASFRTACRRAGITDFRFHDLRHTFASHFLMRTSNLHALQKILGHKSLQMTMRYAHLLDDHIREALEHYSTGSSW